MLSNTFLSPSLPPTCSSKHQAWLLQAHHLSVPCSVTGNSHFVTCCDEGRKFQVTENLNQIVLSVKGNLNKVSSKLKSNSQ